MGLTERTRCPEHQRIYMLGRGYTSEYKQAHRIARAQLAPTVEAGRAHCSRCHQPIHPTDQWDADQRPNGWAASHRSCNRSAGAHHQP
jgi:hypothetical protein